MYIYIFTLNTIIRLIEYNISRLFDFKMSIYYNNIKNNNSTEFFIYLREYTIVQMLIIK
jgi:hypothetical protein